MIIPEISDVFLNAIKITGLPYNELEVYELGNGIVKNCCGVVGKETSKNWFLKQGVKKHTSFDINGRDGAVRVDLGTPLRDYNYGCDLLVNLGTSEHVVNIYECFKNMHNWLRDEGVATNWGPVQKHAYKHSPWGYRLHFPYELCKRQGYELIDCDIRVPVKGRNPEPMDNSLIYWTYKKTHMNEFMPIEEFSAIDGFERRS